MTETLDGHPRLGDISEFGEDEYMPLSRLAVTAFVFGLLSPLALAGPSLYVVSVAGVVLSVAALFRIGANFPAITGRKLAIAGLILSVSSLSIAFSHRLVSRYLVRHEARRFTSAWFQFLSDDQPHKAHQLSRPPEVRKPLDDQLWDAYAKSDTLAGELHELTHHRSARALLALGNRAQVRYYETSRMLFELGNRRVDLIYAVSFEEEGQKKTFFVELELTRVIDEAEVNWYITNVHERARPRGMSG